MKKNRRSLRCLAALLCLLLLTGCASVPAETENSGNLVYIVEEDGFSVEDNGIEVEQGGNAVFEIALDEDYAIGGVDYSGDYRVQKTDHAWYVQLINVTYPTAVKLELTRDACEIVYMSNDGTGASKRFTYDLTYHSRPNTENGTDMFKRDGYTLVGWNTEPDGSGTSVGLGSRVTMPDSGSLTLYAMWRKWSDASLFDVEKDVFITVTGYHGTESSIVIPETIDGTAVTAIASGAFRNCSAESVTFPPCMRTVESGAFTDCALRELTVFDSISELYDSCFVNCPDFETLHIEAREAPYGYHYRRESVFADKIDLLINAAGNAKIVFYGGCSMWYNLDGDVVRETLGDDISIINMGLNGLVNSDLQLQIITHFLEEGDIFFHTPELSSSTQLMTSMNFSENDAKLWAGLEYNYDLVSLADLRRYTNFLDGFTYYLQIKQEIGTYSEHFTNAKGQEFLDAYGCIPFERTVQTETLADAAKLDPSYLDPEGLARLRAYYDEMQERGITVYVSYAGVNEDGLPEGQIDNVDLMDDLFREAIEQDGSATVISSLRDYLYPETDFYDTNYHLLSGPAEENTRQWMRDLMKQFAADGFGIPE